MECADFIYWHWVYLCATDIWYSATNIAYYFLLTCWMCRTSSSEQHTDNSSEQHTDTATYWQSPCPCHVLSLSSSWLAEVCCSGGSQASQVWVSLKFKSLWTKKTGHCTLQQRAGEDPPHAHCRTRENIVLIMLFLTVVSSSCLYLNMVFNLMHGFAGSICSAVMLSSANQSLINSY